MKQREFKNDCNIHYRRFKVHGDPLLIRRKGNFSGVKDRSKNPVVRFNYKKELEQKLLNIANA